jgi:hypothetical protein
MEKTPSPTKKPWVQRRDKNEEINPRTQTIKSTQNKSCHPQSCCSIKARKK